jgi:PIN domain nuclease of toxin-antitoxin system
MLLKTILNRVQKQPGFVYGTVRLIETPWRKELEVEVQPRAGRRPTCSGCLRPGPGYDTLAARRYEFVPLWGMAVFFVYARRRVACPACGVRVEAVPWARVNSAVASSRRLPEKARSLILDAANEVFFSAASVWEVALKSALRRRDFNVNPTALVRALARSGFSELPVTAAQRCESRHCPRSTATRSTGCWWRSRSPSR